MFASKENRIYKMWIGKTMAGSPSSSKKIVYWGGGGDVHTPGDINNKVSFPWFQKLKIQDQGVPGVDFYESFLSCGSPLDL